MTKTKVVIIGGGLTGLTTAFYLNKENIPFILLEKDTELGGVIRTVSEDGLLYECGPNTGVIGNPEVAELFEDLKGLCELEIADPSAKKRLIWKKGKWHPLPSGPVSAITTPLFKFTDKLRILGEPFRKKGTDPFESVADMVVRRLGKSFLDYAIDPFIAGIYSGDPNYLVTKYALPKMHNLEAQYGSLIRGGIKKSKEKKQDPRLSKASREVFSAKGGLKNLISALESSISPKNTVLNAQNVNIELHKDNYRINYLKNEKSFQIESDYVITTTGAYTLPNLLPFINADRLSSITNLVYNKIVLVLAGYKKWKGTDLKAFGGLVPSKEQRKSLGVLFTSSFFKGRAPKEGALLSVFIGGSRLPEAINFSDNEIKKLALGELEAMMGVSEEPDLIKIMRYPNAIAQYGASTKERLETIEKLQKEYPGLILAGNIRDGIGMADRIKQGKDVAEHIKQIQKE